MQVFVATHSYNLSKYLEILRTEHEQVRFHHFCVRSSPAPEDEENDLPVFHEGRDEGVSCISSATLEGLGQNPLIKADLDLLNRVMVSEG